MYHLGTLPPSPGPVGDYYPIPVSFFSDGNAFLTVKTDASTVAYTADEVKKMQAVLAAHLAIIEKPALADDIAELTAMHLDPSADGDLIAEKTIALAIKHLIARCSEVK